MKMNTTEKSVAYEAPEVEILDIASLAVCADGDILQTSQSTGKMSQSTYTKSFTDLI